MFFILIFFHDGTKKNSRSQKKVVVNGNATWKFCNQITLPRSKFIIFVQMFVTLMLIVLCIVKLTILKPICEKTSVWISIPSSLVGYILSNPRLWTNSPYQWQNVHGRGRSFGCGKTNLIFRIIAGNTFYPKFKKVIFLYREKQPTNSQVDQHSNIVFKKFTKLEFLQNTKNCLLKFDD